MPESGENFRVNIKPASIGTIATALNTAAGHRPVSSIPITSATCPNRIRELGILEISSVDTTAGFVAWTLYADQSGAISTLPDGKMGWPYSQWERIQRAYIKIVNAGQQIATSLGVNLFSPPAIYLDIGYDRTFKANARPDGRVRITTALAELIGDSESELAFILAHETVHIMQFKAGLPLDETIADKVGMLIALISGYDPYAAAGALSKLYMATGRAGFGAQLFEELYVSDPHQTYGNRIAAVYDLMVAICSDPQYQPFCSQYKSLIHPDFPPESPLNVGLPLGASLHLPGVCLCLVLGRNDHGALPIKSAPILRIAGLIRFVGVHARHRSCCCRAADNFRSGFGPRCTCQKV
jgi:hypothetical protein